VRRFHANFSYQAATWTKPRRVIAKVEWHPGELYPRVGFIVTNMSRAAEREQRMAESEQEIERMQRNRGRLCRRHTGAARERGCPACVVLAVKAIEARAASRVVPRRSASW
jgi:hypothetical protein